MFNKTFGVELEFIAPETLNRNAIARALTRAGVSSFDAGYTHETSERWKLVSDASVRGDGNAMELVSPILRGDAGMAMLRKACDELTRLGCTVNKSCGLHVHVGARDMSVVAMRRLAILYSDFEAVLDSVMPASRRLNNNMYLRSLSGLSKSQIAVARDVRAIALQINNGGRYAKLNFTSHWKHGTIEFRLHAGTINADKACNWVSACLRMMNAAEQDQNAAVAVVQQQRPRQAKLAMIYDLCARPNGVTREEARIALGRTSAPNMNRITEDAGIQLRRVGQRYFLAEQPAVNTVSGADVNHPITVDGFCTKLAMTEDETQFWKAREAFFASDTAADTVAFAPGSVAARRAGLR